MNVIGKNSIVSGATTPKDVVVALRTQCERHGQVKRISLSCSETPGVFTVMIEIEGNASQAAADIGGKALDPERLCATFSFPPGFQCVHALKNCNNLCKF